MNRAEMDRIVREARAVGSVPCLSGADLSGADLRGVDLRGANLRGANLSRANLSRVDLRRANLSAITLCGARLDGAILSPDAIRGPGHILCALTDEEWATVQHTRENVPGATP